MFSNVFTTSASHETPSSNATIVGTGVTQQTGGHVNREHRSLEVEYKVSNTKALQGTNIVKPAQQEYKQEIFESDDDEPQPQPPKTYQQQVFSSAPNEPTDMMKLV